MLKESIISEIIKRDIDIVKIASSNGITTFYVDYISKVLELLRKYNHEIIIDAHFDEVHVFANLDRILIFRQLETNLKSSLKFKESSLLHDSIRYQGNSKRKLDDDSLNLLSFS